MNEAVVYVRVSTDKQQISPQLQRIQKFAMRKGIWIASCYEEVCCGTTPYRERHGLMEAINAAAEYESGLLVLSPDRLARSTDVMKEILEAVRSPIMSVRDNRVLSRQELIDAAEKAAAVLERIRSGTSEALKQRKDEGKQFPLPEAQKKGARISAARRKEMAKQKIDEVAHALARRPWMESLTNRELAHELNQLGINTTWKREWTAESVKKKRRKIFERLREILRANPAMERYDTGRQLGFADEMGLLNELHGAGSFDAMSEQEQQEEWEILRQLPYFGIV
jgi:DNA invertase Pin-like site-specific DNA recombinase